MKKIDQIPKVKKKDEFMRMNYKKMLVVITAIVVVVGAFLWLKKEWDNTVVDDKIKYSLELADLKQGEEYQFNEIPWGASLKEVKSIVPYSLQWRVVGEINEYKSEPHLFMGRSTAIIYKFKEDRLIEVEFGYTYGRRVKKIKKIIAEVTDVFGPVSEIVGPISDDKVYEYLYYNWETDNTMLEICFRINPNVIQTVTFTVRCKDFLGTKDSV